MPRILVVDDEPDICALIRRYAEHDGYAEFLSKLASGAEGTIEYSTDTRYVYGAYIELENAETAVLYTSVMLGAVGATASIIRTQLLWVTVLSLVIAFMLAAEPGIYGCVLRLKKPLICACIGSAAGSLVAAVMGARYYVYAGLPSILTTVNAISENGTAPFIAAVVGTVITIVVCFALVMVIGFDDPAEPAEEDKAAAADSASDAGAEEGVKDTVIYAPMNGEMVDLAAVPDPTFSEGILGRGRPRTQRERCDDRRIE